ncbi:MAG: hypothetical protein MK135_08875, partial [Polyangiaceae bacterium]|nr:hypothetical protein [Polyangiaceae bacterium]
MLRLLSSVFHQMLPSTERPALLAPALSEPALSERGAAVQKGAARLFVRSLVLLSSAALTWGCITPDFLFNDDSNASVGGSPNNPGNSGGSSSTGGSGSSGGSGSGSGGSNPIADHCTNREKDADEADVDCGGLDCEPCSIDSSCQKDSDCVNQSCTQGRCQDPSCTDQVKNDTETDVDCGGNCPRCADEKVCLGDDDCVSGICSSGRCAIPTCDDRRKNGSESDVDCGGSCSPCEVGRGCEFDSDCIQPEDPAPGTVACVEQACVIACPMGRGDCNASASDGCEVDLNTAVGNCGVCGQACEPANAAGQCSQGVCGIDFGGEGCSTGFFDCDGQPENGCEVNIETDSSNCGGCGEACSDANGQPSCSGGSCSISCNSGFTDCDSDARSNGCEIATGVDVLNCGSCGRVCTATNPQEIAFCLDGDCGFTACSSTLGDCNGNGECTDDLTQVTNCGSCGTTCAVANGSPGCSDSGGGDYDCTVASCGSGFADCNQEYGDGCEVDTNTSLTRCGGCQSGDAAGGAGTDCSALLNNASLHIS